MIAKLVVRIVRWYFVGRIVTLRYIDKVENGKIVSFDGPTFVVIIPDPFALAGWRRETYEITRLKKTPKSEFGWEVWP